MKLRYTIFLGVALLAAAVTSAKVIPAQKMYMFGMAASFTDTIVHFTPIQQIDSAWIDAKNKFIVGREVYSSQLREHLATTQQMPYRTCIVVYDQDSKRIAKKYAKMKRLYTQPKGKQAQHFDVRYLDEADFRFQSVSGNDYAVAEEEQQVEEQQPKKQRKPKNRKKEGQKRGE